MAKGPYRRFIRVNGKIIASPEFDRRKDAEDWYQGMLTKKHFERHGLKVPASSKDIIFIDYCRDWMRRRQEEHPANTWMHDEQRLRDYVLPFLADYPIAKIKATQIRAVLTKIAKPGFKIEGKSISESTRTRVKALLSIIFSDALNEDPPLVEFNPVLGMRLSGSRKGKKKPVHFATQEECEKFLKAARTIGLKELAICALFLMAGPRKQELIALRWAWIDFLGNTITFKEKYEQATNSIVKGTKAGENVERQVPVPDALLDILLEWLGVSKFSAPNDHVFCRADGTHHNAREINYIIEDVRSKAGLHITPHGLRHSYGRAFVRKTGNVKALQAFLGHSSSSTTDIYSQLEGGHLKEFGEAVSFESGVKESES